MGADAPDADVHVDADLVRALLVAQHPDLLGADGAEPIVEVASGWDNAVFRLGDRAAVRMPRRALAAGLVAGEQRWLPQLAERLPVPIPAPLRAGRPGAGYPYAWSVVHWLEGADGASVPPAARGGAAGDLAAFCAALAVPAPADAPANPYRGVPLAERDAVIRERLGAIGSAGLLAADDLGLLLEVWSDALAAPARSGPAVWVHGDLHPANLLLEETPGGASVRLAAVLDFGDLTAGDPATDLATAWLTFDAEGRARFRAAIDRATATDASDWRRARGWAVAFGAAILATVGDQGRIGRIGAHALAEVLAEARGIRSSPADR
ncbi:aminoglycoside phosphotransferase family protein [Agromyces sp. MMS24-K17]|uniref:aminoglycoside phosphotransferase family protein n=1 Tax=Agromyces sp. MMS24-K17 TaxID=3372850 RepID=UPI003754B50D